MWFAFGFISLFSFSLYFLINRYQKNWNSELHNFKGRNYIRGSKSFEEGFYVGCIGNTDLNIDFSIKKESFFDKLFKKLGIAIECQINNKKFDEDFYIITENKQICTYLKTKEEVQGELSNILKICEKNSLKFRGFFFKENRLWIHILKNKEEAINELLPHLYNLIDIFNKDAEEIKKIKTDDKFIFKASILLAINTSLVITSMGIVIFLNFSEKAYLVESWGLIKQSIFIATILISIFIAIVLKVLRKSSRTHLVIFEILTLGYIGFSFGTFSILNKINIDYDTSPPSTFLTRILNKDVVYSTKGGSKYYFYISNWENYNGRNKIRIKSTLYNNFNENDIIKVYVKKGLFNHKWVSNIKEASYEEKSQVRLPSKPKILTINNERVLITEANIEYAKKLREKRNKIKELDSIYKKGMDAFKNNDYKIAMIYFQKGVEQDHAKSFQMIGFMYIQGKGVERNQKEAIKWFKKAKESSIRVNEKDKKKPF